MTPWTAACQALLSMEFSRKEYWSGLPFPSAGNLPNWDQPGSSALQADSVPVELPGKPPFELLREANSGKANTGGPLHRNKFHFESILVSPICS